MSKPNHCRRGQGYYIGYGYTSRELHAVKGALDYKSNLTNEINDLRKAGPYIVKLIKYLKRVS